MYSLYTVCLYYCVGPVGFPLIQMFLLLVMWLLDVAMSSRCWLINWASYSLLIFATILDASLLIYLFEILFCKSGTIRSLSTCSWNGHAKWMHGVTRKDVIRNEQIKETGNLQVAPIEEKKKKMLFEIVLSNEERHDRPWVIENVVLNRLSRLLYLILFPRGKTK